MAFVPRFPTFHTEITPYVFDPDDNTRTAADVFEGQIYSPLRTSDNTGQNDVYLVFPKTVGDIHDPSEWNMLGRDAISFSWNGITWYYTVEQVVPRWSNFPNEHLLAMLKRMTEIEADNVLTPSLAAGLVNFPGSDGLPAFNTEFTPWVPLMGADLYDVGEPFMGQLYAMQPMAEVLGPETTFVFAPKEFLGLPPPQDIPPIGGAIPSSERYSYLRHTWNGRDFLWAVTQLIPRYCNFLNEHWMFLVNQVSTEWAEAVYARENPPGVADPFMVIAGMANGTCSTCASLDGNSDLREIDSDHWDWHDGALWTCGGGITMANWLIENVGGTMTARFVEWPGEAVEYAQFTADTSAWDHLAPVTLNYVQDDGTCVWPATIEFRRMGL